MRALRSGRQASRRLSAATISAAVIGAWLLNRVALADNLLLWGDVHLHTRLSNDAYIGGTRRIDPEQAYRFARGETVMSNTGIAASIGRPLDFIALTDHAENMGLFDRIDARDPGIAATDIAERYGEVLALFETHGLREAFIQSIRQHGPLPDLPANTRQSVWQQVAHTADRFNQPGTFTTLIGYEWTSMISGDNLHRVILYRDNADKATRQLPLDARSNPDPEHLWADLERYQQLTGGQVLAIAHNGNLSNGRMFADTRVNGAPIDQQYAERRARWEPVYEITQVKGDGETHPLLSPDDPYADFETWDRGNVAGTAPKHSSMLRFEYARQSLLSGLAWEQAVGANPFRFGLIGSTDIHTGLSTATENNFYGKFAGSEPSASRLNSLMSGMTDPDRTLAAGGLIAVWAPANTREAIFDAIRRREVYATTGSRIRLQLQAGWHFETDNLETCSAGSCSGGVPMGAVLPPAGPTAVPRLLIWASRDPDGVGLDRLQVVKGWVDDDGQTHEHIYDVAQAGDALDTEATGASELQAWWQDPGFDASEPAVYYVRVLEVPTARWTTLDASRFDLPRANDVPEMIQERAYSSPVWYQPPTIE